MTRKQKLTNALTLAKHTQTRYNELKASQYQAVRNPFPMHQLVKSVLPTLPDPATILPAESRIKTTHLGKSFIRKVMLNIPAQHALGAQFYEKQSMTVDEVLETLQSQGFIVNRNTVACTLNSLKHSGVQATRYTRKLPNPMRKRKNTSYCRYFITA